MSFVCLCGAAVAAFGNKSAQKYRGRDFDPIPSLAKFILPVGGFYVFVRKFSPKIQRRISALSFVYFHRVLLLNAAKKKKKATSVVGHGQGIIGKVT